MAFTRATIRSLAKESGVEIPKEFEDALVTEHLNARNAYAEEQVKAELEKQPAAKVENVKDSEEYKALKADFDKYKAEVAEKETKAANHLDSRLKGSFGYSILTSTSRLHDLHQTKSFPSLYFAISFPQLHLIGLSNLSP